MHTCCKHTFLHYYATGGDLLSKCSVAREKEKDKEKEKENENKKKEEEHRDRHTDTKKQMKKARKSMHTKDKEKIRDRRKKKAAATECKIKQVSDDNMEEQKAGMGTVRGLAESELLRLSL